MCSIIGIIQRNEIISRKVLEGIFLEGEKRGSDGFGVEIYALNTLKPIYSYKSLNAPSKDGLQFLDYMERPNVLLLANLRAQPETEVGSSLKNLQPILKHNCILVHNGSLDGHIYNQYITIPKSTEIDSEAIIDGYIYHYNIKDFMEHSIGGHAFLLLDKEEKTLFAVNDFKPLYESKMINGNRIYTSLPLSDDLLLLENIEYPNYRHNGYTIQTISLLNNVEEIETFEPRFRHPVYEPGKAKDELYIVLASGGIDSGLTAWTLGRLGYNVMLLHFDYGQKGQLVESRGLGLLYNKMLQQGMKVTTRTFDLTSIYQNDPSELIDDNLEVSTGTQNIKSTTAWVSARNLMFSTYAITLAEQMILRNRYQNVIISAGYFNLSESGIYPDNSEYFGLALNEVVKFGTICASRIRFEPLYANVMKSEEWVLGAALDFPFEMTVSCDEPIIKDGQIYLCDNCGSTKLSRWAALMVGTTDPRHFYHKETELREYDAKVEFDQKHITPFEVINKLNLSRDEKNRLKGLILQSKKV